MSLIKLASIAGGAAAGGFFQNLRIAWKGGPKEYFSSKSLKRNPFSIRKQVQELGIASAGNTINRIRSGKTLNTTEGLGAGLDAALGHKFKTYGDEYMKARNHGMKGKMIKYLENKIVKKDGRIDIGQLEKKLKLAKKVHSVSSNIANKPLTISGVAAGGIAGAIKNPDENGSRKNNILSGMAIGGVLGSGAKKVAKGTRNALNKLNVPKIHDEYFADNYWKERITRANTGSNRLIGRLASVGATQPKKLKPTVKAFNNGDNKFTGMP